MIYTVKIYLLMEIIVKNFEHDFSEYCGTQYCVGTGTGLDSIYIILKALGIGKGDEVIIPSNTYIATALAVTYVGADVVMLSLILQHIILIVI